MVSSAVSALAFLGKKEAFFTKNNPAFVFSSDSEKSHGAEQAIFATKTA